MLEDVPRYSFGGRVLQHAFYHMKDRLELGPSIGEGFQLINGCLVFPVIVNLLELRCEEIQKYESQVPNVG